MQNDAIRLNYKKTVEDSFGSLENIARADFEARKKSTEIMLRYVEENSDIQLVIKPHPSEDQTFYDEIAKSRSFNGKDIFIQKNNYIWDLLRWCDVEVSRSCTTAVEAWHIAKPTIDLNPDPFWYNSKSIHLVPTCVGPMRSLQVRW